MSISIKDVEKVLNDERLSSLIVKANGLKEFPNKLFKTNSECIMNYNNSIAYLLSKPIKATLEVVEGENPLNGKKIKETLSMRICKDGILRSSDVNTWNNETEFNQFTQVALKKDAGVSLMDTLLREDLYPLISGALNEEGNNIMNKLAAKHSSLKLAPVTNTKGYYRINNLTPAERKFFEILTPTASLYIKPINDRIMIFLGHGSFQENQPHPSFKYRVFFDQDVAISNDFFPEKVFILSHYDEILRGLNAYENYITSRIKPHVEFLEYAEKLIEKYAVLSKI